MYLVFGLLSICARLNIVLFCKLANGCHVNLMTLAEHYHHHVGGLVEPSLAQQHL